MHFATEHGLPHSVLLGGDGTWTQTDRAKLHAQLVEQSLKCAMCGTADWEWDPAQGGKKRAYEPVEVHCRTCAIKEAASELEPGQKRPLGNRIEARPTGTVESLRRHARAERMRARDAAQERANRSR